MKLSVIAPAQESVAVYAAAELQHFLEKYTNALVDLAGEFSQADRWFELCVDAALPEDCYCLEGAQHMGAPGVRVSGGSSRSLLNGVYELLEQMGVCFGANGDTLEGNLRLDAMDALHRDYRPCCRNRGIRQHINFPMDISAYSLGEAQEYIRNLARMQFNAITFHSYGGQWNGYQGNSETVLPGHFFYGQRHPVPDYAPIAARVRNETDFCIPEVEAVIDDPQARGGFAVRWLNRLIATAKQAGLRVTLSMELPDDETEDIVLQSARNVLLAYPDIDVLEWITPEGGGESCTLSAGEANRLAMELFGSRVLVDGALPDMGETPPAVLYGTLRNLKLAARLYEKRREVFAGLPEKPIQIGLYVTCRDTLKIVKGVMKRVLPPEVNFTFLPAHGAKAAADNIDYMGFTAEDLQKSMLYSWVEFDGNMYLLQNSCMGIEALVSLTQGISGGEPIHGICLNHWRTAENDVTIAYAAKALRAPLPAEDFYREYALARGITSTNRFAEAMRLLGDLDMFNRDRLFNIGFCYLGCWLNAPGLGWIRGWEDADIEASIQAFARFREGMEECLSTASPRSAGGFLRLMENRALCSIAHLRAILTLKEITCFADDRAPERLDAGQREKAEQLCEQATMYSMEYIDRHMEQLPDRGCEGTAVSYYATILVYLDHIRQYFVTGETECGHVPPSFDQPPPPDTAYLNVGNE